MSASRRTDVPALYAGWLMERLSKGYADVANPFDAGRVRTVSLAPRPAGEMDALVLWTRKPEPLLPELGGWEKNGIRSLWLVTLTGYPRPLEPFSPPLGAALGALRALSSVVGPERVVWRYDPLLLCTGAGLTPGWHRDNFLTLARALRGATQRCTVSLFDDYAKARRRLAAAGVSPLSGERAREAAAPLLADLAAIGDACGISLGSCCEDLESTGIPPGACVDGSLLDRLWGLGTGGARDPGQRPGCRCAPSVDIGAYDTCTHGCLYCYATGAPARAAERRAAHHPGAARLA